MLRTLPVLPLLALLIGCATSGTNPGTTPVDPGEQAATGPALRLPAPTPDEPSWEAAVEALLATTPAEGATGAAARPAADVLAECEAGDGWACAQAARRLWPSEAHRPSRLPFLRRGCELGLPSVCGDLAVAWINGAGVPRDAPRGRAIAAEACRRVGPGPCYLALSMADAEEQQAWAAELAPVVEDYADRCDGTDRNACAAVARLYRLGLVGSGPDPARASALYARMCARGDDSGCLGEAQMRLVSEEPDALGEASATLARICHSEARTCPDPRSRACFEYALLLWEGEGVRRDPSAARTRLEALCRSGDTFSDVACVVPTLLEVDGATPEGSAALDRACEGVRLPCGLAGMRLVQGDFFASRPALGLELVLQQCVQEDATACANLERMVVRHLVAGHLEPALGPYRTRCAEGDTPACALVERVAGWSEAGRS